MMWYTYLSKILDFIVGVYFFSESVSKADLIPYLNGNYGHGNIDTNHCPGMPWPQGMFRLYMPNNKLWHWMCYCEAHCRWDKCRLHEPPDECLIGTDSRWEWDSQKKYWVAQLLQGTINYLNKI